MHTEHQPQGSVSPKMGLAVAGVGLTLLTGGFVIFWRASLSDDHAGTDAIPLSQAKRFESATAGPLPAIDVIPPGQRRMQNPRGIAAASNGSEILSQDPAYRDPAFLVKQLSQTAGNLSAGDLDQLNRDLNALVALGGEAIPSIREYLNQFEDVALVSSNRERMVPYPTMRLALLDVLKQIGTPEAIELEVEVLEQTTNPSEIAFLGAALDEQEPGRYVEQVLDASLEVLGLAAEKQLPGPELAPVFKLLGSYSDEAAISALEHSLPVWERYSIMALADSPEGMGVPSILNQIQEGVARQDREIEQFGWEMLAQVAHTNPVARDYLLEAVSLNLIPDNLWEGIAMHAAGAASYRMDKPEQTDPNIRESFTSHRFRKNDGLQGEQLIYKWKPRPSSISDQLEARNDVLDALMGATTNASARLALKNLQNDR